MSEHKTIKEYLDTVGGQIRWKRARAAVMLELEQHLLDQRDAFAEEGHDAAECMAVEEMGDPVVLGTQLDGIHRPRPQRGLLALTLLFACVCAFLRVWLTAEWDYCAMAIDPVATLTAVCLGSAALLGGYLLDYTFLVRHGRALYVGAVLFGVLMLYCSPRVGGVSYYTRYVASCYPVVYAAWFYTCRGQRWRGVLSAVVGGIPLCMVSLAAPSMWGALLLVVVGLALLWMAAGVDWFSIGKRKTALLVAAGAVLLLVYVCSAVLISDSIRLRLEAFLYPERDPLGRGYTAMMVRAALSGAQWMGQGDWSSKLGAVPYEKMLPNCESDFLLTTLIYKLGWMPFLLLVTAFAVIFCWLAVRCSRQRGQLGRVVALSVLVSFWLRTIVGVTLSMGYVCVSASLPFFIGNLQMVLDMGMAGLVLSVFRQDGIARNVEGMPGKKLVFSVRTVQQR